MDTTGPDAHRIETALMPILGYGGLKRELAQLADILGNRERYESAGATMPHGLMIVGEPGLGKTLMARCLINASGLPHTSYRHTHDEQKTADAIRATFEEARAKAPSIVLLDDLDKYSNSDYQLTDTEEFIAVQECIDAVRDCSVFVLATVNDKDKLPHSLRREGRFDRTITVEAPRGEDAHRIVSHYLSKANIDLAFDTKEIAAPLEGHSCAFLETVVNEATLAALYDRADAITIPHFIGAFVRIERGEALATLADGFPPLSFVPTASASPATEASAERAHAAIHEASHVVAIEALSPHATAIAFLCGRPGNIMGVTRDANPSNQGTFDNLTKNLIVALAGEMATELLLGVPGSGAANDNEKAHALAASMVVGSAVFGMRYAGVERYDSSESLSASRERAAAHLMEYYRLKARSLLVENRCLVERVADLLYRRSYLLPSDLVDMGAPTSTAHIW